MSAKGPKEIDPAVLAQVTDDLVSKISEAATDGRITCPLLRHIGEQESVPYAVAGAAAEVAGVRVHSCDLNCF